MSSKFKNEKRIIKFWNNKPVYEYLIQCKQCKKKFWNRSNKIKFCSKKCVYSNPERNQVGKKLSIEHKAAVRDGIKKYYDKAGKTVNKNDKLNVCVICNKEFYKKFNSKRKTCGLKCNKKLVGVSVLGKLKPNLKNIIKF